MGTGLYDRSVSMGVWPGLCLNFAAYWGWHEGRFDGAGTAHLVCRTFTLVEGHQMKTPDPTKAESSAPNRPNFSGTDNPRHLRVIQALLRRPLPREQLDSVAGASNGPELVAELRRRGLEVPCTRTRKKDRDLFDCWPGVYHLTQHDRRIVYRWLANQRRARRG
jgi:hypothetical protein